MRSAALRAAYRLASSVVAGLFFERQRRESPKEVHVALPPASQVDPPDPVLAPFCDMGFYPRPRIADSEGHRPTCNAASSRASSKP